MINALFIGGPADGRRMQVADNVRQVDFPTMPSARLMDWIEDNPGNVFIMEKTVYHRSDIQAIKGVSIFTLVLNPCDAWILMQLLDGYQNEAVSWARDSNHGKVATFSQSLADDWKENGVEVKALCYRRPAC